MPGVRRLTLVAGTLMRERRVHPYSGAGAAEDELWIYMAELLRQVPSWKAMRDARVEIQQKGFRVVWKSPASPFKGRPAYNYVFQMGKEAKTHNIQCQESK